jgi:hypothetical protein
VCECRSFFWRWIHARFLLYDSVRYSGIVSIRILTEISGCLFLGVGLNGLRIFVKIRDALLLDSGRTVEGSSTKGDEEDVGRTRACPEKDWCSILEPGEGSGELARDGVDTPDETDDVRWCERRLRREGGLLGPAIGSDIKRAVFRVVGVGGEQLRRSPTFLRHESKVVAVPLLFGGTRFVSTPTPATLISLFDPDEDSE